MEKIFSLFIFLSTTIGFRVGDYFGERDGIDYGIDCGIIASKMDMLTDNGTGEYKRLSDLYIQKECPIIDVERIRTM